MEGSSKNRPGRPFNSDRDVPGRKIHAHKTRIFENGGQNAVALQPGNEPTRTASLNLFENPQGRTPKIVVIENPSSGINRNNPDTLGRLCALQKIPFYQARNPLEVEHCLDEIESLSPDLLAVSGGDGTVSAIIGAMNRRVNQGGMPVMALLQGGSTNMIHRDVGLHGQPHRALQRLLKDVRNGCAGRKIQSRFPMAVSVEGERTEHFGFFFAIGSVARALLVSQERCRRGGPGGLANEIFVLASSFLKGLLGDPANGRVVKPDEISWKPTTMNEVESNEPWTSGSRMFLFVTSLERLVLGLSTGLRHGKLRLLSLKYPFRRRTLLSYLLSRGGTGQIDRREIDLHSGPAYAIRFAGCWVLDGQFHNHSNKLVRLQIRICTPVSFVCA